MDCNLARLLITLFGRESNDVTPADRAELDQHLAGCATCAQVMLTEQQFDRKIGQTMKAVPVPGHLKTKIMDGVSAQAAAPVRYWSYGLLATAIAVVLGIGGVIGWRIQTASQLDLQALMEREDRLVLNQTDGLDSLLAKHGTSFNPQREFDLTQLTMHGTTELQGKEVPVLYFRNLRKNTYAKVYIVKATQFDLKNLPTDPASFPGANLHQLAVIPHAIRGDTMYIVLYTGVGLEQFLESQSSS